MTKNEFLYFLETSLDFLESKEKKAVLDFFEEKFSFCASEQEETAIIEAFGSPEQFVANFKTDLSSKFPKKNKRKNRDFKSYLEAIFRASLSASEEDVIFSKPISVEKSSKVIHSIEEDREVKTLFGEKVVLENRTEPVKEIPLEPIDEANGLTTEEIRIAKAKTLEKAKEFEHDKKDDAIYDQGADDAQDKKIPLEESDSGSKEDTKSFNFPGLFNRIVPVDKYNKSTRITLLVLLTLAVSPLLLLAFGLVLSIYAILVAFTACVAGALFALMIGLIAAGVVELVYGFLILFDSVPAALIELGFGTILFAFVVAVAALIYEFLFAIVPKWLKWLTKIFFHYTKLLYFYLYGGKA